MTHEELLAKINENIDIQNAEYGGVSGLLALQSVVELHKGQSTGECGDPDCCGEADIICGQCQVDYPCLTIQAIEKELK